MKDALAPPMRSRLVSLGILLIASLLSLALYYSALQGAFFFDDLPNLVYAEQFKIQALSVDELWRVMTSGLASPTGRPVAQLSFALNYYALAELSPWGFKLTNLLIHFFNTLLVYLVCTKLLKTPESTHRISAALIASLWLLHPIQLFPVLLVVQRMTSLSALFLLIALLLHIQARQEIISPVKKWFTLLLAWGVAWPLSMLSKETGIVFPLLAFAWEYTLGYQAKQKLDLFARGLGALLLLVSIAICLYLIAPSGQWIFRGYDMRTFSLSERLLTEARVFWFYLSLILFPQHEAFGLFHDDIPLSSGLFSPISTFFSVIGLAIWLLVAFISRQRAPLLSLGLFWFVIGHLLESTFLPLEIAHEHRNYLPLLGILLAAYSLIRRLLESPRPLAKNIAGGFCLSAIAYAAVVTGLRAAPYSNEILRTQIEAQHHRHSARSQSDAGSALSQSEAAYDASSAIYALAQRHFELALSLDPQLKTPWLSRITMSCRAGQAVPQDWLESLEERLSNTPFAPGDQSLFYLLKEFSIQDENVPPCFSSKNVTALFEAAFRNPKLPNGRRAILYSWLADYWWLREHNLQEAQNALSRSLAFAPTNPSNQLKWAQLLFIAKDFKEAKKTLKSLDDRALNTEEQATRNTLLQAPSLAELP